MMRHVRKVPRGAITWTMKWLFVCIIIIMMWEQWSVFDNGLHGIAFEFALHQCKYESKSKAIDIDTCTVLHKSRRINYYCKYIVRSMRWLPKVSGNKNTRNHWIAKPFAGESCPWQLPHKVSNLLVFSNSIDRLWMIALISAMKLLHDCFFLLW